MTHQRLPQEQRLEGEALQPALLGEGRGPEAERGKALRVAVNQALHPELVREASQLADGRGPLIEVHEVRLDAPFGEEPQRGARVAALPGAEDLDLQRASNPPAPGRAPIVDQPRPPRATHLATGGEPQGSELHQASHRRLELAGLEAGPGGKLGERAFAIGEPHERRDRRVAPRHGHATI